MIIEESHEKFDIIDRYLQVLQKWNTLKMPYVRSRLWFGHFPAIFRHSQFPTSMNLYMHPYMHPSMHPMDPSMRPSIFPCTIHPSIHPSLNPSILLLLHPCAATSVNEHGICDFYQNAHRANVQRYLMKVKRILLNGHIPGL